MYSENFKPYKLTYIIIFLLTFQLTANAQNFDDLEKTTDSQQEANSTQNKTRKAPTIPDNIYFGGDFSLSLGSNFYFSISPEAGYKISDFFHVGTGLYYMYNSVPQSNYSMSVYGGRVYTRIFPLKKLFLQGEYEILNAPRYDPLSGYKKGRTMVPGALAGLGYMEKSSGRFGFYVEVLYNFILSDQTPYYNPVIRTGFVF